MKLKIVTVVPALLFLLVVSSNAQSEFESYDRIITQITRGVQRLKIDGTPGLITVSGEQAFTILTDARGRTLIAGAKHGNGRVAAITHSDWISEKSISNQENNRLMGNLLLWLAGGKKSIRMLSREIDLKAAFSGIPNLQFEKVSQYPADLQQYDLILIDFTAMGTAAFDSTTMQSLKKFVADGGGILCSALGWVYTNYGDGKAGKSLEKDFIGNIFLKNFGMMFNNDFTSNDIQLSQSAGNKNHPAVLMENVSRIIESGERLSEDELNGLLMVMLSFKNKIPYSETYLRKFEGYYESYGDRMELSEQNPVLKTDTGVLLTIGMLNLLYNVAPYNRVKKLKHVAVFPGDVESGGAGVDKNIQLDLSRNRWQSTGLYAPAGRPVAVTIDQADLQKVMIRIGSHTDILFPLDNKYRNQLKRWPDLLMTKVLDSGQTFMTSPHGGLIYLERVGKPDTRTITIKISGGVVSPLYVSGRTSIAEWQNQIRNSDAPWGEIVGGSVIFAYPVATLKKLDNPEKVLRYWDSVLDCYPVLVNEQPRDYRERVVPDMQPLVGYMHAGYPIVTRMDVCDWAAGVSLYKIDNEYCDIYKNGSWGHFHEFGHNYQKPEWTFEGATEVTVNLFTLYAMEKVQGIIPAEHPWHKQGRATLKKYIAKGSPFEEWKKDPQLALTTYIFLQKEFGWEAFRKVFANYQKLKDNEKPKNDQEKRDLWLVMFSNVVKKDLGPYFTTIGIPVSAHALQQVRQYPRWMPDMS